jgi:hypothetical protein
MNYLDPRMQQGPMFGMADNEARMRRPFLQGPMQTGGALPPQGYDSSGINPGGMYTGGPMQSHLLPQWQQMAQQHQMGTGGALPPQQMGGMQTGGNLPPQPMRLARMAGNGPGFGNRLGGLLR